MHRQTSDRRRKFSAVEMKLTDQYGSFTKKHVLTALEELKQKSYPNMNWKSGNAKVKNDDLDSTVNGKYEETHKLKKRKSNDIDDDTSCAALCVEEMIKDLIGKNHLDLSHKVPNYANINDESSAKLRVVYIYLQLLGSDSVKEKSTLPASYTKTKLWNGENLTDGTSSEFSEQNCMERLMLLDTTQLSTFKWDYEFYEEDLAVSSGSKSTCPCREFCIYSRDPKLKCSHCLCEMHKECFDRLIEAFAERDNIICPSCMKPFDNSRPLIAIPGSKSGLFKDDIVDSDYLD